MDITDLHKLFLKSNGICTDTRKIKNNNLFFALKGDNFNGNTYAKQAIEKGALYAIIDDEKFAVSEQYILVNDTLKTLQNLAKHHREYLNIPIIALTGSNGKTTTKELINCVLSSSYQTTATSGNLNNHIGVPLTLLSMNKNTEIGIVEMGANHQKEIEFLCKIACPDFGYITNIGKAHLEGFGSLEGVLKGKTELYRHLKKHNKLIFLNTEDTKLSKAAEGIKTYTFSQTQESDITIQLKDVNPMVSVLLENKDIHSHLIGSYNFTNISAAIAIGFYFKINTEKIKTAIESYIPSNNRSQIIQKKESTIILDAYNANPSSMSVAIDNFHSLDYKNKTVFLGDMFELGDTASDEHQKIAEKTIQTSFNTIYLIGHNFFETSITDPRIIKYRSFEALKENEPFSNIKDAILIKGSRGMKLERILDLIK
ncbi:UDP-N-acetylmuramoyl-tripeptide--D-alanyl-D-alanine ligase [Aquimarina amphilecti]|uniref:UDP-N-acetylmuramoyl-tripeptide--D-alanyl-D-alanine ligase n=1 Tax=Aquimarina amphilecti TaxID=1038014 RepID=A0A1H7UYH0_AQUAM|nr:UDP-N-acetylmuramoyl-tripeptide--D-alanyl-D-alanine ligase [Aquimarina amphilecti]SEM02012.1 UDP-N-acetylmuramoyl-tripeptide--D-alanyl-D-alanine ligase [Aquimarina amphilecti]